MKAIVAKATIFIVLAVGSSAAPVLAHHSIGREYDQSKTLHVTGKIATVQWSNPHVWIGLEVMGANSKLVIWPLETRNIVFLTQNGWKKDELVPGAVLIAEGHPGRSPDPGLWLLSITFASGKRLLTESGAGRDAQRH